MISNLLEGGPLLSCKNKHIDTHGKIKRCDFSFTNYRGLQSLKLPMASVAEAGLGEERSARQPPGGWQLLTSVPALLHILYVRGELCEDSWSVTLSRVMWLMPMRVARGRQLPTGNVLDHWIWLFLWGALPGQLLGGVSRSVGPVLMRALGAAAPDGHRRPLPPPAACDRAAAHCGHGQPARRRH